MENQTVRKYQELEQVKAELLRYEQFFQTKEFEEMEELEKHLTVNTFQLLQARETLLQNSVMKEAPLHDLQDIAHDCASLALRRVKSLTGQEPTEEIIQTFTNGVHSTILYGLLQNEYKKPEVESAGEETAESDKSDE